MTIKSAILPCFLLLPVQATAFEFSEDYYCATAHIHSGACKKGDLMRVQSASMALKYCDFDKEVIPYSAGDNFICYFRGSERPHRIRLLTDEEVMQPSP